MLSAAIAYQVLRHENPSTIEKVKGVLEKHPWYASQWQARLCRNRLPRNSLEFINTSPYLFSALVLACCSCP
jgi:hypothetical protein